jgi:phenylacetate-coenzyme A ligase PaaK-like adenylate-forming protein
MDEAAELRRRHVADMQRQLPAYLGRLDWPAERLKTYRTARLRALLRAAAAGSPWHRARLAGVDIDTFDETRLDEVPVMTKDDLMEHFDEIVTDDRLDLDTVETHLDGLTDDAYLLGRYHAVASGGSSGQRGVFAYDWDGWTASFLPLIRHELRAWIGPRPGGAPVTMAVVAAGRPTHGSSAIFRSFGQGALSIRLFPVGTALEATVEGLNRLQPTIFSGYPSALHLLADAAIKGDLRIRPRRVITFAEPLLPETRGCLEETFGVGVCNWWTASEAFAAAIACGEGPWMHLSDDLVIVEPIDRAGRAVGVGERSAAVLLTNLYNHALPLVRYHLTDEVTFLDGRCPCGSAHRLVGDIAGRLNDTFDYDGVAVHPHVFRSPLTGQRHVAEYQVRQTATGAEVLIRRVGPVDIEALRSQITRGLSAFLPVPEVTIAEVDEISRQGTGKLKRFVPLAASPCPV